MRRSLAVCAAVLAAGVASVSAAQSNQDAGGLRVLVLEGEGAINNIREHTARAPVVRVLDESEKPIAGATVNFLLPDLGPGGTFPDDRSHLTTRTDQDGRAIARGLRPNNVAGRFAIRVSVSAEGRSASVIINQINVAPAAARGKSKTKYVILALVAGGAAGGIFAAKGGGKSSSSVSTSSGTTITPGSPVFGPPR